MIAQVQHKQNELTDLCRKYAVRRLDLFGSAATEDEFDPARSDIDFLVDFEPAESIGPADQYFGLLDDLKALFERDVHLVTARSMRNPYFIESVETTRKTLYAA